jgi:hypothetical protein
MRLLAATEVALPGRLPHCVLKASNSDTALPDIEVLPHVSSVPACGFAIRTHFRCGPQARRLTYGFAAAQTCTIGKAKESACPPGSSE